MDPYAYNWHYTCWGGIANPCPKWGVYAGKPDPLWNGYPWLGGTSRQIDADVLKVGKLDGNDYGPFANTSTAEIALLWPFLRSAKVDYGKEYVEVEVPGTCIEKITKCRKEGFIGFALTGLPIYGCIDEFSYCVLEKAIQLQKIPGEILAEQILNEDPLLLNLASRAEQELYEDALNRYVGLINGLTDEWEKNYKTGQSIAESDDFFDWMSSFVKGSHLLGTLGSLLIDEAITDQAPYPYKADVLEAQLDAELTEALEAIQKKVDSGATEVLIEVGNEPNLFPYIPPTLYAKYYVDWVHAIKDGMTHSPAPHDYELKFMPGGLADVNSMDKPIKKLLSHGVSFTLLGWKLGFSQQTDDLQYYKTFLESANAYEKAKYGGTGVQDIIDYGNVHLYPMSRVGLKNADGSDTPVTQADLANDFDEKMNLLAENSKSGKIIISEYGNITPYSEQLVVNQVMKPLVEYISSRSDVESAYWFLARGVDDKYSNLGTLPAAGEGTFSVGKAMSALRILFQYLNVANFVFDGNDEIVATTEYMTHYKQELEDGHPEGADANDTGTEVLAAFAQLSKNEQYTLLGQTYRELTGACYLTNTELPAGNSAAFIPRKMSSSTAGIDPELSIKPSTVNARPVTQFSQSRGDWNFKHTFVFDHSWASTNYIDVQFYIDPADLQENHWLGTLRMVTFDGIYWNELNNEPQGERSNDLRLALGKMHTMRFEYNPAQYRLGQELDLIFFVNAHNGSSPLKFSIGKVSIVGAESSNDPNPEEPTEPVNPGVGTHGNALTSTTGLTTCNQCAVMDYGGRTALSITPNGGGNVMELEIIADASVVNARRIALDIRTNYTPESWNEAYFIVVNPTANRYWDESRAPIPATTHLSWTKVEAHFTGQNYTIGDKISLKVSLNTNVPFGKNIYISNLRWEP